MDKSPYFFSKMTAGSIESVTRYSEEMESKKPKKIVITCIDFRKVEPGRMHLQSSGLRDGDYFLLATAGAARNENTLSMAGLDRDDSPINLVFNINHKDCGFAKALGDDSEQAHEASMQKMGKSLRAIKPNIGYSPFLLPVRNGDLEKHTCKAVALILGKPSIVKKARQELDHLGLTNNHDEIARPYKLDVDDESIWQDLDISLRLHKPNRILIFDESAENVRILVEKASQIAAGIEIEPKIVARAA